MGQKLGWFLKLQSICNNTAFQLKADQMHFAHVTLRVDLDLTILIHELHLKILKM